MENENILLNPIDIIEDVIHQKKWNFSRAADHELVAEISSQWSAYRLYFTWSENINALSLSITFDIRFPELYQKLSNQGCNIITIPSAFTVKTGKFHWEVLLRARAIETSCWILAPAQIGEHYPKRKTWGHSMVVDPWGNIIVEARNRQKLIYADLDLNRSNDIKKIWGKI